MKNPKNIAIEEYDYLLPDEKIAKYPLAERDDSKLLVFRENNISEDKFVNIAEQLPANSLLVFNNTKVIQARIEMQKETGARIEIFCLEPHRPASYELAFSSKNSCIWKCIVGNAKKWKGGVLNKRIPLNGATVSFTADCIEIHDTCRIIEFSWDGDAPFSDILEHLGQIPIPPYLNRKSEALDSERYQTVYSKHKGSVAAPTAGLHFTPSTLDTLKQKGISTTELTLHVGAGTFKPVQSKHIGEHDMHTEFFSVQKSCIESLLSRSEMIIPVGTTSLRTLESLYRIGVSLIEEKQIPGLVEQWDIYRESPYTAKESLNAILQYMEKESLQSLECSTRIMIAPGYKFRIISALITNFHQPKSTLLLLIAALTGERWKAIYDFALKNDFRFLSYGDSSILFPAKNNK